MQRTIGILFTLLLGASIIINVPNNIHGSTEQSKNKVNQQKVVILTFDDGYESQYSNAKPILDKYGFKATFYIVCNYVGSGDNRMTWEEIKSLQQEGHDIASHTMNHDDLSKLTPQGVEYEVVQTKQCLLEQGINPKSFAYPFNGGSDDSAVINTVASHYELARTATDPLAFLGCDGDCTTNKYSIMGWSHDSEKKSNAYNDKQMFERFIQVVNSQNEYNTNGVNAVPILIWHKIDNSNEEYSTSLNLFEAEMKYLHDNGFTVLTMANLVYDDGSKYIKISSGNDRAPLSNNQNDFAAKVTDVEKDSGLLSSEEEPGTDDAENTEESDTIDDEATHTTREYDRISDENEEEARQVEPAPNSQSSFSDNEDEEAELQLPSAILQFLEEP
ncbi:MAG TPA: polysaccharide deacetylase family protein [Nitrososphaeraceae archaeon]|nr:polysaccharide deacetylase family protein [Nitrososphaeraceae archaeon]